jgi:diaminohydroxyphosphoribosylaminopyrimidine deaminase / 5-amino-6-(5-phosphoribosylamino)uracil reductase
MEDEAHMRAALALARRGLGSCWPNPEVGCVVVRGGRVVGRAVTAAGGRPHAEALALEMAGAAARGATVYVTLEPCCHRGRTAPCTAALIAAGVARVVIGARDPDPRVDGGGIARLRAAGIGVTEGLLAAAVEDLNAGFFSRVRHGRPLVTLKLASTLDGRIATRTGESRWITGEAARRATHALRGRHDAVLVGVGTVLADDPDLTCRLPGYRRIPLVRVVVDSDLRTSPSVKVLATARETPTWLIVRDDADAERKRVAVDLGARLIEIAGANRACSSPPLGAERLGEVEDSSARSTSRQPPPAQRGGEGEDTTRRHIHLAEALTALATAGLNRLLVEGGAAIAAALLRANLVDRIAWFHAPGVMGEEGWPAARALGIERLAAMPRFVCERVVPLGDDVLTELRRPA